MPLNLRLAEIEVLKSRNLRDGLYRVVCDLRTGDGQIPQTMGIPQRPDSGVRDRSLADIKTLNFRCPLEHLHVDVRPCGRQSINNPDSPNLEKFGIPEQDQPVAL